MLINNHWHLEPYTSAYVRDINDLSDSTKRNAVTSGQAAHSLALTQTPEQLHWAQSADGLMSAFCHKYPDTEDQIASFPFPNQTHFCTESVNLDEVYRNTFSYTPGDK